MHTISREETQSLVRWLRLTLDLTQEEAGRLVGGQAGCVSRWESGKTSLSCSKASVFRLIERAVFARGAEFMRREALTLELTNSEALVRLVHLGDERSAD